MASLFVKNLEKFELQRDSSQRDLKVRSNYRNFRITEIGADSNQMQPTVLSFIFQMLYILNLNY